MSKYLPKPKSSGGNVKVKLDLSNYATKADFKMKEGLIHQLLQKKLI